MNKFETIISDFKDTINSFIEKKLWPTKKYNPQVSKAMKFALNGEAKRLRPILTLLVAKALGEKPENVLKSACVSELIHSASLILDDLPCMDNAKTRRNRKTTHIKFGENISILAAIAMHTFSAELLMQNCMDLNTSAKVTADSMLTLCKSIGNNGLIYGQEADLFNELQNSSLEKVKYIIEHKTASLFMFASIIPGILFETNKKDTKYLNDFGKELGILFQIKDDFLDAYGSSKNAGKDVRKDSHKGTYPSLVGKENTRKEINLKLDLCISKLDKFSGQKENLINFAKFVANYSLK